MADVTKTYKTDDWQIFTYVPEAGSFVLDFSQLNGSDVLGTTIGTLAEPPFEIAGISITEGGEVSNGFSLPVTPSVMSVQLMAKDFDINDINYFLVGTPILATVLFPSSASLNDSKAKMFQGFIDSVNVSVNPGANFSTISIEASARSKADLNAKVGIQRNNGAGYKATLIKSSASDVNIQVFSDFGSTSFAGTTTESKTLGEWLTDLALTDFMNFKDYPVAKTNSLVSGSIYRIDWNNSIDMRVSKSVGTSVGTLAENNITEVSFDWSGKDSPTSVDLTNTFNSEIVYSYGVNQSNGSNSNFSASVDVFDLGQMAIIGQQILSMNKNFRPISVSTEIASQYKTIEYRLTTITGDTTLNEYIYPENLFFVGETITIDLPDNGVDEQKMLITGRTMNITPDNWTTTYQLWKGFTN